MNGVAVAPNGARVRGPMDRLSQIAGVDVSVPPFQFVTPTPASPPQASRPPSPAPQASKPAASPPQASKPAASPPQASTWGGALGALLAALTEHGERPLARLSAYGVDHKRLAAELVELGVEPRPGFRIVVGDESLEAGTALAAAVSRAALLATQRTGQRVTVVDLSGRTRAELTCHS